LKGTSRCGNLLAVVECVGGTIAQPGRCALYKGRGLKKRRRQTLVDGVNKGLRRTVEVQGALPSELISRSRARAKAAQP